jgi:hypothetical protein
LREHRKRTYQQYGKQTKCSKQGNTAMTMLASALGRNTQSWSTQRAAADPWERAT